MITVSVIIPSYKPDTYLEQCIESVVHQTLDIACYEVLIVLNGDKDPYYARIVDFIQKYSNVKLIYTSLSGVSNARNMGIESSVGDYVCFVDDDDMVSSSYLEKLLEKARADTISISNVFSFRYSASEFDKDFFICKHWEHKEKYIGKSFYHCRSFLSFPVAKMIHRNIISDHRFDTRFKNGEDALFITSLTDNFSKIDFTSDDAIYYVRLRKGSASRRSFDIATVFCNSFSLIGAYIVTYFTNSSKYSLKLFLSRFFGVAKNAYILLKGGEC